MVRLLLATRSEGKRREFASLLVGSGWEPVLPESVGLSATPSEDTLEIHDTFVENAIAKARYFADRCSLPVLAEDSGLEVAALGGGPGVYSKRWSGNLGSDGSVADSNNRLLLEKMRGISWDSRQARYVCALAFIPADRGDPQVHVGVTAGRILTEPLGQQGFGYDPLFWSEELQRGFGEIEGAEKALVSHRARACAMWLRAHSPVT